MMSHSHVVQRSIHTHASRDPGVVSDGSYLVSTTGLSMDTIWPWLACTETYPEMPQIIACVISDTDARAVLYFPLPSNW